MAKSLLCRIRPYSVEYTRSRSISEVKQLQAGLVLGWVTAWEFPVPYPFTLRVQLTVGARISFWGSQLQGCNQLVCM